MIKLLSSIFKFALLLSMIANGHLYSKQFPDVVLSVFVGKITYGHLPFLLESMKWNEMVQFRIINIIESEIEAVEIKHMTQDMSVTNLLIETISYQNFSLLIQEKLGIAVPFNQTWYYKICDYKPTLAHLFPHLVDEKQFAYWGFADLDVVWGNFTRYSHWLQGDIPVVVSGWIGTTGAAAFFVNQNWTRTLFMEDPLYIPLLANHTYHNLDEGGTQTDPANVVDNGIHSFSLIQFNHVTRIGGRMNHGVMWKDHCFIDAEDSLTWAGPVRWFRGTLQILHKSEEFPAGRELLFYHRPELKQFALPDNIKSVIYEDMMIYGYLLPNWIPLLTRAQCKHAGAVRMSTLQAMEQYHPFNKDCFVHHLLPSPTSSP